MIDHLKIIIVIIHHNIKIKTKIKTHIIYQIINNINYSLYNNNNNKFVKMCKIIQI